MSEESGKCPSTFKFRQQGDRHPPRMLMGVAISSFVGLDGFCVANEVSTRQRIHSSGRLSGEEMKRGFCCNLLSLIR